MKKNLLVLCTGNSCRSQMAHGYFEKFGGNNWNVYSAGIETHGLNPRAVKVMMEDGIDISHNSSNNIDEYGHVDFDIVLTVCDNARERCPYFPTEAKKIHYDFNDPAEATGTEEEILTVFRTVRDEIKAYCQQQVESDFAA